MFGEPALGAPRNFRATTDPNGVPMPVILVVDDSPMDQALIGQLLKDEALDWIVEFAESAEE